MWHGRRGRKPVDHIFLHTQEESEKKERSGGEREGEGRGGQEREGEKRKEKSGRKRPILRRISSSKAPSPKRSIISPRNALNWEPSIQIPEPMGNKPPVSKALSLQALRTPELDPPTHAKKQNKTR